MVYLSNECADWQRYNVLVQRLTQSLNVIWILQNYQVLLSSHRTGLRLHISRPFWLHTPANINIAWDPSAWLYRKCWLLSRKQQKVRLWALNWISVTAWLLVERRTLWRHEEFGHGTWRHERKGWWWWCQIQNHLGVLCRVLQVTTAKS